MKIIIFATIFLNLPLSCILQESGSFMDTRDGIVYKWVKIGKQTWMAENLRFKTDSGSYLPDCDPKYYEIFGLYYNFETAKKVCPAGWHLPSDDEWNELNVFLGGRKVSGGKLKAKSLWIEPNKGASNESGFSAFPGGVHDLGSATAAMGMIANFWTSTMSRVDEAYIWALGFEGPEIGRTSYTTERCLNVRCLKDSVK